MSHPSQAALIFNLHLPCSIPKNKIDLRLPVGHVQCRLITVKKICSLVTTHKWVIMEISFDSKLIFSPFLITHLLSVHLLGRNSTRTIKNAKAVKMSTALLLVCLWDYSFYGFLGFFMVLRNLCECKSGDNVVYGLLEWIYMRYCVSMRVSALFFV